MTEKASEIYFRERPTRKRVAEGWIQTRPQSERVYLRKLYDFGQATAVTTATSGFDHGVTLARICSDEKSPQLWSYLTLARAASEALVRAAYLSDIATSPEIMVVRSAAYTYAGWLEQLKLARSFASADVSLLPLDSRAEMQTGLDGALQRSERLVQREATRIRRAGLRILRGKDGPRAIAGPTSTEHLVLNMTEESNRRLIGVPVPYRIASAGAHSSAWFLMGSLTNDAEGYLPALPDPNLVGTSVLVALESLVAVVASATQDPEETSAFQGLKVKALRRMFQNLDRYHSDHASRTWPPGPQ